jgi:predicted nucleic acid-binding protein
VFLDANVLFSAAYREGAGLTRLWDLSHVALLTSAYAIEEARRNLDDEARRDRLRILLQRVAIVPESAEHLAWARQLIDEKDAPILAAARAAKVDTLLTGDVRHFGALMDRDDLPFRVSRVRTFLTQVD